MRSVLLAAALVTVAATAHAQPVTPPATAPVVHAVTPRPLSIASIDAPGLVAALQRAGFAAESKTEAGRTYVIAKGDTTPFQALLSNCQPAGGRCTDIELFAGFNGQRIAWERINGWNARTRFARAFLDESHDPALQMDLSLKGGVSPDSLNTSLETWGSSVETFSLFLAARVPPAIAAARPGVLPSATRPVQPPDDQPITLPRH